jgi:hypothetical protein
MGDAHLFFVYRQASAMSSVAATLHVATAEAGFSGTTCLVLVVTFAALLAAFEGEKRHS